jgi:hypothetical protein
MLRENIITYVKILSRLELARHWWYTPVILTIQEPEIRRIVVQSQPRANSL